MPIIIRVIIIIWCAFFIPTNFLAQCDFQVSQPIPDQDTLEYAFLVFGLVNDSLADPDQGVCSVSLSFDHEYLGDLQIELVSPSGQVVQLVGPATNAINPTNLSQWDISFIPCSGMASPDAGFSPVFSNDQPWQILSVYSGSYFPHAGCLEDFNAGLANGTWILRIIDTEVNSTGTIESFSIEFCENAGLGCAACEAHAGEFPVDELSICEADQLDPDQFTPVFPQGSAPDPALYQYLYLLRQNGQLIGYDTIPSFQLQGGLQYEICGLSVALSDTAFLFDLVDTASLNTFVSIVESIDPRLCADLTNECILIHVESEAGPTPLNQTICRGDTILIDGTPYADPGTYDVRIPRPGRCDSLVQLTVAWNQIEAVIEPPQLINCDTTNLRLTGRAENVMGMASYFWYTNAGTILSDPNNDTIRVGRRERYFFVVDDGTCADTSFVDVVGDITYPVVIGTGAIIDCNQPVVEISAIALPEDVSFMWKNPGGQQAGNAKTLQVDVPGKYVIEVLDQNGCSSVDTVFVGIDTISPDVDIAFIRKNCASGVTVFRGNPGAASLTYSWTGPNLFTSSNRTINASDAGYYVLEITDVNGCTGVDSIFNDADYQIPILDAQASDSLGCGTSGVLLNGTATPAGGDYAWTGPQGFSSSSMSPVVYTAGTYTLSYTGPNQCTASVTADVFQGSGVFPFDVLSDTISCKKDSALIGITGSDLSIQWNNVPDSVAFSAFLKVFDPGTYSAIVTDTLSGCIQIAEVEVSADLRLPTFSLVNDTLTCADTLGRYTIIPTGSTQVAGIAWELPDQSMVSDSILFSPFPGLHRVIVTDQNGCERNVGFRPALDTIPPEIFTSTTVFGCVDSVRIFSISVDSIEQYHWTGPGSFISDQAQPMVPDSGLYILFAESANGCRSMDSVYVRGDKDPPEFTIQGGILTCDDPMTELSVMTADSVVTFAWYQGSDTLSSDSILAVNRPGTFFLEITGENACTGIDSIFIDGPEFPSIRVEPDTITCAEPVASFYAMNVLGPATYQWVSAAGAVFSTDSTASVTTGDSIRLVLTGQNGCMSDTVFMPYLDTIPPVADIRQLDEILCQDRMAQLDGTTSAGRMLQYFWVTTTGEIIGNPSDSVVMILDTGSYRLIVEDSVNGCRDTAEIQVRESMRSILDLFIDVSPPGCEGEANGSIAVDSVVGGTGQFTYFLNTLGQVMPVFTGLSAGEYVISVEDTTGCIIDTIISLPEPVPLSFTLGDLKTIYIGETVRLEILPDFDSARIRTVLWDPDIGSGPCPACLTYQAAPLESTTFRVLVEDSLGCQVEEEVFVQVIEKGKIFVPNVFSPNGDGQNDRVQIYSGPGVEEFIFFGIYDRWGNQVYGAEKFALADLPLIGWDGTLEGDMLTPAVFTYIVQYRLLNGKIEIKTGDILLVR